MDQINDLKNRDMEHFSRSLPAEFLKYLPQDLLPKVTVLLQYSGYVTVKPTRLTRSDWSRLNKIVRQMGGIWISNNRFSHWSIPYHL